MGSPDVGVLTSRIVRWLLSMLLLSCDPGPPAGTDVGAMAPPLVATAVSGEPIDTSALDRPTVLFFWASWSGATRHLLGELPASGLLDPGIDWISINAGEPRHIVSQQGPLLGLPGRLVADPEGRVGSRFSVDAVPVIVVLDARGVVRFRGHRLPSDMDALLRGPDG